MATEDREFELEYRLVQPSGEIVWVVSRARSASGRRRRHGAPSSASLTDITSRKRAEQRLALSAEVMRDMGEGVCVVRASDAKIVFVNPTFERMLGYDAGELTGKSLLGPRAVHRERGGQRFPELDRRSPRQHGDRSATKRATAARTAR